MAGMMRLFQMLNSIGLLALFFNGVKKAWPTQVPQEDKDAYLSVICSDAQYFKTMIEETAAHHPGRYSPGRALRAGSVRGAQEPPVR